MRLLEAILEANHRAVVGDGAASVPVDTIAEALPLVALTCIDARLNLLLPGALGIAPEHFIWLRNAGNIVTGPLSSTLRSLALACAVKGGREIAIIGHTDCLVGKTTTMRLLEQFRALGVERRALPENLHDYFGLFASERQNVMKGVENVRRSPLIGAKTPVHGLMLDLANGRLEWVVNGYQSLGSAANPVASTLSQIQGALDTLHDLAALKIGDHALIGTKFGHVVERAEAVAEQVAEAINAVHQHATPAEVPMEPTASRLSAPPRLPLPKPILPKALFGKRRR